MSAILAYPRLPPFAHPATATRTGQQRRYDVRASIWIALTDDALPERITFEATWDLTVEDVVGSEHTLAGRLRIRAIGVDAHRDMTDLAAQLSPTHVVTFRRQTLTAVEAASTLAMKLVSRLALALCGVPTSPHDLISIARVALRE